ncbi:MAG: hypothetical protein WCK84_13275 [Bacteroidota bacterium]
MKKVCILFMIFLFAVTMISCDDECPVCHECECICTGYDNSHGSSKSSRSNYFKGNWSVTQYSDRGSDETNQFAGYVFTFTSRGTITAVKAGSTVIGSWSKGNHGNHDKLYLDFGTTVPFGEITDDWQIIEMSHTNIRLKEVSGGSEGTDILTFEKN